MTKLFGFDEDDDLVDVNAGELLTALDVVKEYREQILKDLKENMVQ
jgi:hypothetical protein